MIKPIKINNYKSISFGSIERDVFEDEDKKDIKYRNNTWMFRGDLEWNKVIDKITEGNVPKKIYCYACSDGSEPYSIAIGLISKLGYDGAQKYFPIIARDIDEEMINRANLGILGLQKTDIERIEKYQKNSDTKFFKSVYDVSLYLDAGLFYFQGEVSDKLRSCVDFKVGDIVKDSYDFDYNNSVIFFRNAMPYIPKDERAMLLATFARNLNDTTAIAIGSYDKKIFRSPLIDVQNHTFGLVEPIENFYVGKRLRDIPSFRYVCLPCDDCSYIYLLPDKKDSENVKTYNKFVKSQIIKNNSKINFLHTKPGRKF